ncbi:hypothetical protein V6N13_035483 [Hibiscus sabdariffa]|uniref:Uncharacterized protein n=1 Tax=Hibiscus sabdariffa TaxID=183260 RepID=A0ABR2S9C9_9ROSI
MHLTLEPKLPLRSTYMQFIMKTTNLGYLKDEVSIAMFAYRGQTDWGGHDRERPTKRVDVVVETRPSSLSSNTSRSSNELGE